MPPCATPLPLSVTRNLGANPDNTSPRRTPCDSLILQRKRNGREVKMAKFAAEHGVHERGGGGAESEQKRCPKQVTFLRLLSAGAYHQPNCIHAESR